MTIRNLTEEEKAYFQQFYKAHEVVGMMEEENGNRIIVKMKRGYKGFTPYGVARDCGNHYIIANYSSYDSVDKKTLEVTKNTDDK
jgi:hypothetical protein